MELNRRCRCPVRSLARQLPGSRMNAVTPAARRLRPHSRAGRIALAVLAALVVFFWAFDWNWCRPLIRHYVMSRSGRSFEFDDMKVRWRDGLDPTIEFHGLTIQNAPWASDKTPFIHAGRIALTVSWRSLGSDMTVVSLIEMEDAQVDMERLADGLRNWRITRPDDRGPPRVRVLALDARRSTLHAIHRGIGLEVDADTTPLDTPLALRGHTDLPLTRHLTFKGTYQGHAFAGQANASDVLTFGATPRMFALQGAARFGALQLHASGLSNDVHALGNVDLDATLAADAQGAPWPLPAALARMRPLAVQGHVTKTDDAWTGSGLRLHAGRQTVLVADVAFTGNFKSQTPRRTLKATLHDAVVDLADVQPVRDDETTSDAGPMLSTQPLPMDRLRELDAEVDLQGARLIDVAHGLVQSLRGHATLARGVLDLRSLDAGVADGHVIGSVHVDASNTPSTLAVDLEARGLHVERLSTKLAADGALTGAVDAQAKVKSRGASTRALAQAATGTVTLSLADGASVSRRLDAKLGLDGGEWLRTLLDKSARVPVQCAAVTLALDHGTAASRRFVFETADTALAGHGNVDLVGESVDATLTPARKKLALLSLDKSIHVQGPWHDVKITLQPPASDTPERCAR